MRVIKPKKLRNMDVIGIIAPSSQVSNQDKLEMGVKYFEKLGYRVEVGANILKQRGYLAGTDTERTADLHQMFASKQVKMIICLRGGYGASRLLDKINFNIIRENPKIFCGYSDVTVLLNAFFQKTGLVTFSGPMVGVDFYKEINPYTEEHFWHTVTCAEPLRITKKGNKNLTSMKNGLAEGSLIGGNLSMFTSLMGSDYLPDPRGKLMLLEEVGEAPYRIDRMLNQLKLGGYLKKIKGIVLAGFTDCNETDPKQKSLKLEEVIEDYFIKGMNVPVLGNLLHGHLKQNLTLPFGVKARIECSRNTSIEFLESHLT
jgi:muramoyltetrapeptide carboxypeptidase